MLQELSIRNFAIISQLNVSFSDGMTVLTGETGAGKSIVIDAVGLLVGGRASTDYIRTNEEKCQLEGLFILPHHHEVYHLLEEHGIECEDDMIVIQRDINHHGRNTCRINGHLVNTTLLKEVGSYLVDIQGQHDNQRLMQPENHLSLLEHFATEPYKKDREAYLALYHTYQEKVKKLQTIKENEQAYIQRIDMLKYQIEEIEEAQLEIGEEEQLKEERHQLTNFQRIYDQLNMAYQALSNEESGTLVSLGSAMNAASDIASFSKTYEQVSEQLNEAFYMVQDSMDELYRELDHLEMDESRLDDIEERLRLIRNLERKYGASIEDVLDYYQNIKEELSSTLDTEGNIDVLQDEVDHLYQQLETLGHAMTKQRHDIARHLEEHIQNELSQLYMENARFKVEFISFDQPKKEGLETIEFYIATNKGEALKPLYKVVSGGELSRMTLALKSLFMNETAMTSIVFDEVDTGVSGRVAAAIAKKISALAKHSQVLCITHLPQVAAMSDHHYFIEKNVCGNRTEMTLTTLNHEERIQEIARMLSGNEMTPLSLEHAKEMLEHSDYEKEKR